MSNAPNVMVTEIKQMVKNVFILLVVLVQNVIPRIKYIMILKSTYTIKFTVDGDPEETKIKLILKPIKGMLNGFKAVYTPNVLINDFETDEFNDLCEGTVNAKFSMEEISKIHKKSLKTRYRKEKKNFRLVKETLK